MEFSYDDGRECCSSRKTIIEATGIGCPLCSSSLEKINHLIFGCLFVAKF